MTARHDPRDPLTAEERALAAMLDTPSVGPSAAIDARILAAARAAPAGPASRPAAPATSVPAAAIDADRRRRHHRPRGLHWTRVGGVAASLVLVIGLGWRLALEAPMQHAAADMADVGEEAQEVVSIVGVEAPARMQASPPSEVASKPIADAMAATEPRAEVSAAATGVVSDAAAAPSAATAAVSPKAVATPLRRSSPASAAVQSAPSEPAANAMAPPAPAPPATPSTRARDGFSAAADDTATQQRESLDRIEVTGSRIRLADVDISDDARLPIADWFQRIRQRRDEGDLDGARGSLARFRAQHPRVALPGDLRALEVPPR